MAENRFNLIDEKWIPLAGEAEKVSLKQIFKNPSYRALGGNAVQKISIMKSLLGIAQISCQEILENENDWKELGTDGLAEHCLAYLNKWHDRFYLYGEQPFLQMPAVCELINARTEKRKTKAKNNAEQLKAEESGKPKSFGAGFYPDLPSENNTMLSHTLFEKEMSDAEKAVFIVSLMNFGFGGKRVESDLINLSGQVYGNLYSAKSSPSLGNYVGYLHSYLVGENLLSTLWLNLLTQEQIENNKTWENGLGIPPWEKMPTTENCPIAESLKKSYMACLVAMSRFVFLDKNGIYYLDGIQYPSHKEGWYEPSMAKRNEKGKEFFLWLDPNKRPWRELTSLLSFIDANSPGGFDCQQLSGGLRRARKANQHIGIWSGGLKVRANSGDQSVKQDDDFIESCTFLPSNQEQEETDWYDCLKLEMAELEQVSKIIYGSTLNYFKYQKADGKNEAGMATHLFWQLCERQYQELVLECKSEERTKELRKTFASFANTAYNTYCPNQTARQIMAWSENLPNLGYYLKDVNREKNEDQTV